MQTWPELASQMRNGRRPKLAVLSSLRIVGFRPGDLGSIIRSSALHGVEVIIVIGGLSNRFVNGAFRAAQLGRGEGWEVRLVVAPHSLSYDAALAQLRDWGVDLVGITSSTDATPIWNTDLSQSGRAFILEDVVGTSEKQSLPDRVATAVVPVLGGGRLSLPAMFEAVAYESHRQTTQGANTLPVAAPQKSQRLHEVILPSGTSIAAQARNLGQHLSVWGAFEKFFGDGSHPGTVIVLAGSQHAGNLASAMQSAVAHGVQWVLVLGGVEDAFVDKAFAIAGMNASKSSVSLITDFGKRSSSAVLQQLQSWGFELISFTEAAEALPVWSASMVRPRQAFIFGKESGGIPEEMEALVSTVYTVPQVIADGNLNVSSAVEAVLYERHRQLPRSTPNETEGYVAKRRRVN